MVQDGPAGAGGDVIPRVDSRQSPAARRSYRRISFVSAAAHADGLAAAA